MYTEMTSIRAAMSDGLITDEKFTKYRKFLTNVIDGTWMSVVAFCFAAMAMSTLATAQQREIVNQSFENLLPTNTNTHGQSFPPTSTYSIAGDQYVLGWTSSNGYIEVWRSRFGNVTAADGNFFVELNPTQKISLSQEVCLYSGETLSWSFQHRARDGGGLPSPQTVNYEVLASDGNTYNLATQATNKGAGWVTNTGTTTYSGPTGVQKIQFTALDTGSSGNFLDNIQISLLPTFFWSPQSSTSTEIDGAINRPSIAISGEVAADFDLEISVIGGTATQGADYVVTNPVLTIPAGTYDGASANSLFNIGLTILADADYNEPDETVILSVAPAAGFQGRAALGGENCTVAPSSLTHTIQDITPELELIKSADTSGLSTPPQVGDVITFTFSAENSGNVALDLGSTPINDTMNLGPNGTGASVSLDAAPALIAASDTNANGRLDPAETFEYTARFTLIQAVIDAGGFVNTASTTGQPVDGSGTPVAGMPAITDHSDNDAAGDGTDGPDVDGSNGSGNDNSTVVPITTNPDITISKTADQTADVLAGETVTYAYTVQNTGNVTLNTISVSDQHTNHAGTSALPVSGEAMATDTAPTGDSNDAAINGVWDRLAVGDIITFTATYTVQDGDIQSGAPITNVATVSAKDPSGTDLPPASANASVGVANWIDARDRDYTTAPIPSQTGGNKTSVLVNDRLIGNIVNPADVALKTAGTAKNGTTLGTTVSGITMDPDGMIIVAAGTKGGIYEYTYEICEIANPSNCDVAIARILITPILNAVDNSFGPVNGANGATTTSVLDTDTIDGIAATTGNITLATTGTAADGSTLGLAVAPASGSITMNPDGTITIAPGTTAGEYRYTYEICEPGNPTNCDTAVATIVVQAPEIDAVDDNYTSTPIDVFQGGSVGSILENDTLNTTEIPENGSTVTISVVDADGLSDITIDAAGNINIPALTPAGTYEITYQLCDAINPTNCDTAVATITLVEPSIIDMIDQDLETILETDRETTLQTQSDTFSRFANGAKDRLQRSGPACLTAVNDVLEHENILFQVDKAFISRQSYDTLDKIAEVLGTCRGGGL